MAETIEPPVRQDAQLGHESQLEPKPDWEPRYAGSDRLKGKVAPCFLFLACEDSSYVTGLILHPDGGDTMSSWRTAREEFPTGGEILRFVLAGSHIRY